MRLPLLPAFFIAAGCGLAAVPAKRLFPVLPAQAANQARLEDGWTVSVKGDLATGKVNLTRAGATLSAQVEVHNDASELPLRTPRVSAYDKDRTLLAVVPGADPAGAFQDNPVPKSFSNRGLVAFGAADRAAPFTVELLVGDGKREETLTFAFKEFGPPDFWADPDMALRDPGGFFRTLSFEERQDAFNTARKVRRDPAQYARLKTADPKRWELLEWVRLHEYDIEF